jgi:hypothetical protein
MGAIMKRCIVLYFLIGFSAFAQEAAKKERSMEILPQRGYTYHIMYIDQFFSEMKYLNAEGKNQEQQRYVALQEGKIIYTFLFLRNEEPNMYVIAYVFDEEMVPPYTQITADVERGGIIQEETFYRLNDYYLNDGTGKERFFTWVQYDKNDDGFLEENEGDYFNNRFIKRNVNDEAPNVWIKMDMNNDGIVEDNEGRYAWH